MEVESCFGAVGNGRQPHFHFLERNIFFYVKSENKIFTSEELMRLELIYWKRHEWYKVDSFSEFVVLAVNWAMAVTNNEFARLCF